MVFQQRVIDGCGYQDTNNKAPDQIIQPGGKFFLQKISSFQPVFSTTIFNKAKC